MRTYGNLINRITEHTTGVPTVGMGATACAFTDRYAGTIIEIISPSRIKWREDKATRTNENGTSDVGQRYTYEADPDGRIIIFTKRRNGVWREAGIGRGCGLGLRLDARDKFHDFSF
ncbi:MAG: hypothetical protein GC190_19135 [Alphaproteobacteria bacterium]|nr:hypothetical protein [Alphaproteobacteria bacterium]